MRSIAVQGRLPCIAQSPVQCVAVAVVDCQCQKQVSFSCSCNVITRWNAMLAVSPYVMHAQNTNDVITCYAPTYRQFTCRMGMCSSAAIVQTHSISRHQLRTVVHTAALIRCLFCYRRLCGCGPAMPMHTLAWVSVSRS